MVNDMCRGGNIVWLNGCIIQNDENFVGLVFIVPSIGTVIVGVELEVEPLV